MGRSRHSAHNIPLKIATIYAVLGALWILLSDRILAALVRDPDLLSRLQTFKGGFYVLVTAAILYLLIRHYTNALKSQFDEIRTIFDALNAVVYVADFETREMLYLNRQGELLFGDWKGRFCYDILQTGQNGQCDFCTNDRLVVAGVRQPPYIWEFQNTANHRWYQCIDKAIRWTDGRLVRLEVAIDITETKEMERLKDEMLSSVSHEMRTPLTAILGYAEYLVDNDPPAEERREHLQVLLSEGLRLNQQIDNFMRLNRLKARRESYRMVPLRPSTLLGRLEGKFATGSCRHHLRIDVAEEVPAFWGDLDGISLVLDNLVSNAVKYSPQGGDIIVGADSENGLVRLWVKDQGIGMAPDELERIFGDFYRIDNTDRRQTSGAGLGLTLAREIVQLHQGRIWAESAPGRGSTIFLALPAAPAMPEPLPIASEMAN
ncbi:sensor histidine kinase [Trichloromonas sp.]|uniref:sensor histidine kinase n=1 Tax=Trichloromonas sp. TaxID=3069249 RepID=UPI003D818DCB